jgi:hypothetical protein
MRIRLWQMCDGFVNGGRAVLVNDIHKIFADLIARRDAEDPSHPVVEDAGKWAGDRGAL